MYEWNQYSVKIAAKGAGLESRIFKELTDEVPLLWGASQAGLRGTNCCTLFTAIRWYSLETDLNRIYMG